MTDKKITDLDALTTADIAADYMVVVDSTDTTTKKMLLQYLGLPTFLTTPLTSTAWDGDAYSTTAKTKIDLSSVFSAPAGIKAVLVAGTIADSGSATADCSFRLSPNDTANQASVTLKIKGVENNYSMPYNGVVPCDSNGDIYYQIVASDTSTMRIILQIWGYWA